MFPQKKIKRKKKERKQFLYSRYHDPVIVVFEAVGGGEDVSKEE